jgi:hypothetical protein
VSGLDEMLEDVLTVGRAVPQPAEQSDELGVDLGDTDLHERVLSGTQAELVDLNPAAFVDLLDAVWVDPAVED